MKIKITIRQLPTMAGIPFGHVMIGFYTGTCNFPTCTTMWSRDFWNAVQKGAELEIGEPVLTADRMEGNAFESVEKPH